MNNQERVEAFRPLIEKFAMGAARNFPDVDWEDVAQELYVLILKNEKLLPPDEVGSTAGTVLWFAAKRCARAQRAEHLYITSQYSYTVSDVRNLLEDNFDRAGWQGGHVPEDAVSESGSDDISMRADIAWAYDMLPDNHKESILRRYGAMEIPQSASPEGRLLRRAIDRLVDVLNSFSRGSTEGPGNRRVMSNASAGWLIDNQ